MKPNIGISENHLKNSIDLLAKSLGDEVTLYSKIRKFHWNVSGESFMELHKLFQTQYTELEKSRDFSPIRWGLVGKIIQKQLKSKSTNFNEKTNKRLT